MSDLKPAWQFPPGLMRLASAGVELAAGIGGACLLGWWIDRHFETNPWGLLVCAILGVVGSLYNMIRKAVHEMLRESACKRDKHGDPPAQAPPR